MGYRLVPALAACALVASCSSEPPSQQDTAISQGAQASAQWEREEGTERNLGPTSRLPPVVPGELLVKFRRSSSKLTQDVALSKVGGRSATVYRSIPGLVLVKLPVGTDEVHASQVLEAQPEIEYAEPNFLWREYATEPNDPDFLLRQWALKNVGQTNPENPPVLRPDIRATLAWDITTGDPNLVAAVIDGGIEYTHPDLANNIYRNTVECTPDGVDNDGNGYVDDCHGIDTHNRDSDPMDDRGHGTHVAGILGAVSNNGVGIAGVAWNVKLLACKFIANDGLGANSNAVACLDYVADLKRRGVNIVVTNNSWGGIARSRALDDAVRVQRDLGILFVAAAGNNGWDNDLQPDYPCNSDSSIVVCVAATYESQARFSNYGRRTVHLGAPGTSIYSTDLNATYSWRDGTSMAAPHVAAAAVLLSAQNPARDWRTIKNLLIAGTTPPAEFSIWTVAGGRLDLFRSMTCSDFVLRAPLRPLGTEPIYRPIGARIELRAQSIRCGVPDGPVYVDIGPLGQRIELLDNGAGADEVAGDGVFSAVWTTTGVGDHTLTLAGTSAVLAQVVVDDDLKRGFVSPSMIQELDITPGFRGEDTLAFANVDSDPEPEIVASDLISALAWNADGSAVAGWEPFAIPGSSLVTRGEFDADPLSDELGMVTSGVGLQLRRRSGQRLPGWPQIHQTGLAVATYDFDRDGIDEIVSYPGRRADGTLFGARGFPSGSIEIPVGDPTPTTQHGPPALVDLDSDGVAEVVSTDNLELAAWSPRGSMPGFPSPDLWVDRQRSRFAVSAGDFDADGRPEILVPARRIDFAVTFRLNLYDHRGRLLRTLGTSDNELWETALADLDGDGVPEIIAGLRNRLIAWRGDGTEVPGWPVFFDANRNGMEPIAGGNIAVGDISGDGLPDIVTTGRTSSAFSARAAIFAFNRDGTPLPRFPKTLPGDATGASVMIEDIDRDGRNDLIVLAKNGFGTREAVFVFDLRGAGPYGPVEWGQYQGNSARHATYVLGQTLRTQSFLNVQVHGSGSVRANAGTIDCTVSCAERVPNGSQRVLTATAGADASFLGWTGACANQSNPCTVSVSSYTPVAAEFASNLTISLSGDGQGTVTSEPAGIACPGDCSEPFGARRTVTLRATAAAGSGFIGWSGACSGDSPTCEVLVDRARQVTAEFSTRFPIRIAFQGSGGGRVRSSPPGVDCTSECVGQLPVGSSATISVTPNSDSQFLGWIGDCAGGDACTITMDRARNLTARFRLRPVVTIVIAGAGRGRVTSSPAGIDCPGDCTEMIASSVEGINVTAIPDANSVFAGWSGGSCVSNIASCRVTSIDDVTLTARFEPRVSVTVSVSVDGGGSGRITSAPAGIDCGQQCVANFPTGTSITLTATAGGDSVFTRWVGACTGSAPTCVIAGNDSVTVGAEFTLQRQLSVTLGGTGLGQVTSSPAGLNCASNCSARFNQGARILLTATPSNGHSFAGWGGSCTGSANSCEVTLNVDSSVTANFNVPASAPPSSSGGGGSISPETLALWFGVLLASRFRKGRREA